MPTFHVSQAEKWYRDYRIEAENLEQAKDIYREYKDNWEEGDNIFAKDPQYLEDIEDDVEWYED
jgi:hypothetical protein